MGREDVACYRLYAANCIELAQNVVDPDRRLFLFRMAQAWAQLANQVEEHSPAEGSSAAGLAATQPDAAAGHGKGITPQSK